MRWGNGVCFALILAGYDNKLISLSLSTRLISPIKIGVSLASQSELKASSYTVKTGIE
jgi:hypothetical protein